MAKQELDTQMERELYNALITVSALLTIIPAHKRVEMLEILYKDYCTSCGNIKVSCNCTNKGVTH